MGNRPVEAPELSLVNYQLLSRRRHVLPIHPMEHPRDMLRLQARQVAADAAGMDPGGFGEGIDLAQGELVGELVEDGAETVGTTQLGDVGRGGKLRHQQAAVRQADVDDGEGRLEMGIATKTLVPPIAQRGRLQRRKDHTQAVDHQPVTLHRPQERLVAEQIRLAQQRPEMGIQLPPLPCGQLHLQTSLTQHQGCLQHPLRQRTQVRLEMLAATFCRHILPDRLAAAGIEQQTTCQPILRIGNQTGELPRRTRQQDRQAGPGDANHLVVRLARRSHRLVMEGLAQQVVKLPIVLPTGTDQRVDLAIDHQTAYLAVFRQVDQ